MLALNRSRLNREYVLINALKALVSIVLCVVSMQFSYQLLNRYFTLFTKEMFRPFGV
jgi:hypothetical protein